MNVHIHAPRATTKNVLAKTCPDCGEHTRMLCFFTPWYGWDSCCLKCGREWSDGHWISLPFHGRILEHDSKGNFRAMPPRELNIERAKKRWRSLPPQAENHFGVQEVVK